MAFQIPATPFGERVAHRLRDEKVIWFTTVDEKGTPQPTPVGFLWDEASAEFLIYSMPNAKRLQHLQHNPHISLNFDGDGTGGDIIVFTGQARFSPDELPANQVQAYVDKYRNLITPRYGTLENFASRFSVALRVLPSAVRGR